MTCLTRVVPIGVTMLLTIAFAAGGAHAVDSGTPGASDAAPPPAGDRMATPEIMAPPPVVPGKSELPESAFKKLDAARKGYVTRDDTAALEGFERVFRAVDTQNTGRLDYEQFKKAWTMYSGYDDKR